MRQTRSTIVKFGATSSTIGLATVDDNVIRKIIVYLSPEDKFMLSQVNQRFRNLRNLMGETMTTIDLDKFLSVQTKYSILHMAQNHVEFLSISLQSNVKILQKVVEVCQNLKKLKLDFSRCHGTIRLPLCELLAELCKRNKKLISCVVICMANLGDHNLFLQNLPLELTTLQLWGYKENKTRADMASSNLSSSIPAIKKFSMLNELVLSHFRIDSQDLNVLEFLPNLESFTLQRHRGTGFTNMNGLKYLKNLKNLNLCNIENSAQQNAVWFPDFIKKNCQLKHLKLNGFGLSSRFIELLSHCELETLSLEKIYRHVDDEFNFEGFHKLQSLKTGNVSDESIIQLMGKCPLSWLHLTRASNITSAVLDKAIDIIETRSNKLHIIVHSSIFNQWEPAVDIPQHLLIEGSSIYDETATYSQLLSRKKLKFRSLIFFKDFSLTFASYYIFGCCYPTELSCTLEFIQRALQYINPTGSKKNQSKKRKHTSFNVKVLKLINMLKD